jgi:branched-chain amino acid transport system substrate-binding protein
MLVADRIIEAHPEAKRIAIISADNSFAKSSKAYAEAGIAAHGDKITIVYNQSYSAEAAGDMLSLLSPVMETKPDIIIEAGFVPSQQAQMVEVLDQLGFEGYFGSEAWNLNFMTERLGADRIAGRLYSGYALDASESSLNPRVADFYKSYVEKYGEKEWSVFASIGYATVATLEAGFKLSKSASAEDFVSAVHASPTLEHPLFGASTWSGQDVFGINNHLYTPLPIYNVGADGKIVLDKVTDVDAWWKNNKALALPVLEKESQVYK